MSAPCLPVLGWWEDVNIRLVSRFKVRLTRLGGSSQAASDGSRDPRGRRRRRWAGENGRLSLHRVDGALWRRRSQGSHGRLQMDGARPCAKCEVIVAPVSLPVSHCKQTQTSAVHRSAQHGANLDLSKSSCCLRVASSALATRHWSPAVRFVFSLPFLLPSCLWSSVTRCYQYEPGTGAPFATRALQRTVFFFLSPTTAELASAHIECRAPSSGPCRDFFVTPGHHCDFSVILSCLQSPIGAGFFGSHVRLI